MKNYYFRKAVLSVFLSVITGALLMSFGVAFGVADYGPPGTLASPEFSGLDIRGNAHLHGDSFFTGVTLFRQSATFGNSISVNGNATFDGVATFNNAISVNKVMVNELEAMEDLVIDVRSPLTVYDKNLTITGDGSVFVLGGGKIYTNGTVQTKDLSVSGESNFTGDVNFGTEGGSTTDTIIKFYDTLYLPDNGIVAGETILSENGNIMAVNGIVQTGKVFADNPDLTSSFAGNVTISKDLEVKGSLKGDLNFTGEITAQSFGSFYKVTAPTVTIEYYDGQFIPGVSYYLTNHTHFPGWKEITVSCNSTSHKAVYCGHTSSYAYMFDGNYPDSSASAHDLDLREGKTAYSCKFEMWHNQEVENDILVHPYVECWNPTGN